MQTPEEHAANPPETWEVVKAAERCWHLRRRGDEYPMQSFKTKHEAEQAKVSGHHVRLYNDEARWMAGETVHPWKPYAQVVAERQRQQEWNRTRAAQRETAGLER